MNKELSPMRLRPCFRYAIALSVLLCCATAHTTIASVSRHRQRYELLHDDGNKIVADKGYALAWNAADEAVDFDRFHRFYNYTEGNQAYFSHVRYDLKLRNYVVEINGGRAISPLPGCDTYLFQNHSSAALLVSPKHNTALVTWFGSWQPKELYFVALQGSQTGQVSPFYQAYKRDLSNHLLHATGSFSGFRYLPDNGHGRGYLDLHFQPRFGKQEQLSLSTDISESKSESGWFYHVGLTYPRFGTMPSTPIFDRYTEACYIYSYYFHTEELGPQFAEWIIRNAPSGETLARADVYPTLRRDILRRIRARIPTGLLGKTKPNVYTRLRWFTENTWTFDVAVYPTVTDDWDRETPHYEASMTYSVRWVDTNTAVLRRVRTEKEGIWQEGKAIAKFGLPLPPQGTKRHELL